MMILTCSRKQHIEKAFPQYEQRRGAKVLDEL